MPNGATKIPISRSCFPKRSNTVPESHFLLIANVKQELIFSYYRKLRFRQVIFTFRDRDHLLRLVLFC